jgi:hypothetical protein
MESYSAFLEEYAEYPGLFEDISCEEEAISEAAAFAGVEPQWLGARVVRRLREVSA